MVGAARERWRGASASAVVLGAVLAAGYLATDSTQFKLVAYEAVALAPFVATLIAIWRFRPAARRIWLVFAAGVGLDYVGELLWDLGWKSAGSVPDIAYFAGYLLTAAAVVRFAQLAYKNVDADDLLDIVIVWVGLLVLATEFLVEPAVRNGDPLFPRVVTVAYPVIGAGVLMTLGRLLADRTRRVPAVYMLGTGLAVRFITDFVYALQDLHGSYVEGSTVDIGWMLTSTLLAAAALHPSMRTITLAPTRVTCGDGRFRLLSIGLAVVTIPLAVGAVGDDYGQWWTQVMIAALDLLVLLRIARLIRSRTRTQRALARSVAQQAAVATLGRRAVEGESVEVLTRAAADARRDLGDDADTEFIEALAGMLTAASARRDAEARLSYQALHDPLTGLPNRLLFLDHVEGARARAARSHGSFGLLFLDLDRFKVLNDSAGHGAGDELLVQVATRLRMCARSIDTVARFGGDEFALLCEDLVEQRDALILAERVIEALRAPFDVDGEHVVVTASVGVAIGRPTSTAEGLLRDADAAMYRAKEIGRDRYVLFDDVLLARAVSRLTTEQELRAGIARGELRVHYQPAVVMATGAVVGHEALVRWQHPTRGLLLPGEFLDVAEETGLIIGIGEFVINQALRDLADPASPTSAPGAFVAVNLSVRQLTDTDLTATVADGLRRNGVEPHRLCLEITEHALAGDPDKAATTLARLDALGVRIAVDDFGTGYSSLTYLRQYPVDVLKIDASFVAGMDIDPDDTAIVKAVITLGHALGLMVLAEGIERPEQAAALTAAGCDWAQGLYLGAPAPLESLVKTPAV